MTDLRCYVPRLDCQPADACPDIAEIDSYKLTVIYVVFKLLRLVIR